MKFPIHSKSHKLSKFIQNEDWYGVQTQCEKHPREAKVWTTRVGFFDGCLDSHVLPIHEACANHAPKDAINALIKAYSKGLEEKESRFERLPIHLACQFSCSEDVIELLLSYDPLGAQIQDSLGRFPIHYVCSNGASPKVIDAFLSADSETTEYPDKNGWLALHVAVHMGASTEAIKKLIDANPSSVNAKTAKGSTPMKLLSKISCKNKDEIAKLLENASSTSATTTSKENISATCRVGVGHNVEQKKIISHAA